MVTHGESDDGSGRVSRGSDSSEHTLQLQDADGALWRIDYDLVGHDGGATLMPPFDVVVGSEVFLEIGIVWSGIDVGSVERAVVIRDAAGLVAFLEDGGHALGPHAMPSLEMASGASVGMKPDECGSTFYRELVFTADDELRLVPATQGELRINERLFMAHNAANLLVEDNGECTGGTGGFSAWAVWRGAR